MTLQQIAARFEERGFRVKWQPDGGVRCQCSGHGGKDLNLVMHRGDRGGIVVSCKVHDCPLSDVAAGVGLEVTDFMPAEERPNGGHGLPYPEPVARYRYTEEFEVWRFEPGFAGEKKSFRPHHLDASGQWKAGNPPSGKKPLYRLTELTAADPKEPVFIAAGEKDADNLARLGLLATTNPGGEALKWGQRPEWVEPLAGRRCIILEDCDPPDPKRGVRAGEEHAKEVFAALTRANIEAKRLLLPGLGEGEDVSDWLRRGGTAEELRKLAAPEPHPLDRLVFNGPALLAAELREPEWLVPGLVAKAVMTMLVGIGKIGKSVLAHQLTVAAASGGVWLDQPVPPVRSLYINWEDPLGLTRARAVQQFAPKVLPAAYHAMQPPWGTQFDDFLVWLEKFVSREEIGLVVIDPLAIAAGWKDENDNSEVGPTLRGIQEVAQRTGAAVPVVHHTRKSPGEGGLEVRGGSAIFAGIQGFMSFRRKGDGFYELDTLNKMPGEYGGERTLLLQRQPHTLTWHIATGEALTAQEAEKQLNIEEMVSVIRLDPGVTRAELAALIRVSAATLRRYIEPLIEQGVLLEGKRLRREGDPKGRPPAGLFCRAQEA